MRIPIDSGILPSAEEARAFQRKVYEDYPSFGYGTSVAIYTDEQRSGFQVRGHRYDSCE